MGGPGRGTTRSRPGRERVVRDVDPGTLDSFLPDFAPEGKPGMAQPPNSPARVRTRPEATGVSWKS